MFLRKQIKSKYQQINSLLEQATRRDEIYHSKKGSLLPANVRQTNKEQKSDQKQIPLTLPIPAPKKNLRNSDAINIDNKKRIDTQTAPFAEK